MAHVVDGHVCVIGWTGAVSIMIGLGVVNMAVVPGEVVVRGLLAPATLSDALWVSCILGLGLFDSFWGTSYETVD